MLLNGVPVRTVDPGLLRATSYGHFTSMQVRDARVDGLDLHFERLDRSSREVFGQPVSADRVRSYLRAALDPALPIAAITTPNGTTTYNPHTPSADTIAKAYASVPAQTI